MLRQPGEGPQHRAEPSLLLLPIFLPRDALGIPGTGAGWVQGTKPGEALGTKDADGLAGVFLFMRFFSLFLFNMKIT